MMIVRLLLFLLWCINCAVGYRINTLVNNNLRKQIIVNEGKSRNLLRGNIKMTSLLNNNNIVTNSIENMMLPSHPNLIKGSLPNGFTYVILPNGNPSGRFEAHLEVLSGSVYELERQQGMAHLLEHVAYMGSPKRQLISGTGSRTNAYTDFHHTVFFASCPTKTPDKLFSRPMLPMAFDALLDVMTTNVDVDRLEKERAAVLSEASMVNTMEYRVECQILSALHDENRISYRFPIGKEDLIKKWTREDVQFYHNTHYTPENVVLFVIGDVDVKTTINTIKEKFGNLKPKIDSKKILTESKEFPIVNMKEVNRHFPPVTHVWSCSEDKVINALPQDIAKDLLHVNQQNRKVDESNKMLPKPKVFNHDLLQSFSFHLFAKRPIEPITSYNALKREIMRRIALSALQIRFNVQQRQDPLFTFVDFNQLNWPREGCAVCSLDMTTDPLTWKDAIKVAITEIRRLGAFGLTNSELVRYKQAVLSDAEQLAAQYNQVNNEEMLNELMEAVACGHTFMHRLDKLELTNEILNSITTVDINEIASELCEHLSAINAEQNIKPAAIIACTPKFDRNKNKFTVSEEEICQVIQDCLKMPLEPPEEQEVPKTLISADELTAKINMYKPKWDQDIVSKNMNNPYAISQKVLTNGLKVNMKSLNAEPQSVSVRLYVPGGRILENKDKPGAILLGSKTIQEGGAFLSVTREEVELFCIDHLVMVDIQATEDALVFDFQSTTAIGGGGEVTGIEAVFQVLHIILTDFKYEEDAFERAKLALYEQYNACINGLESACYDKLLSSLTNNDKRYTVPTHDQLDSFCLDDIKKAVTNQLNPSTIEVSIAGDLTLDEMNDYALKYLGTVPPKQVDSDGINKVSDEAMVVQTLGKNKQLSIYLPDSDRRAMGYVAGEAPNKWGIFSDGTTITDRIFDIMAKTNNNNKGDKERRSHQLFGNILLLIVQEICNRRLFSIVREERQLTYDASFSFIGHESLKGGWYMVSVTSSPSEVQEAVKACKESLLSLTGTFGVAGDAIQSAKRTLLNRFKTDSGTNKFWVESLSGTQVDNIQFKTIQSINDFESVLLSITPQDVQLLIDLLKFNNEDTMTSCVGISSPDLIK
jgi:predicted Zn-dependent peptidase